MNNHKTEATESLTFFTNAVLYAWAEKRRRASRGAARREHFRRRAREHESARIGRHWRDYCRRYLESKLGGRVL